ncbi:MAG: hypothetical protein K8R54_16000 [Bacteroidales bacterium]|nr:hypothetical protein [Bacteroidales bacterium]
MNIQAEKLGLIEWIISLKDVSVIEKLKKIHIQDETTNDWHNEISIEEKLSIERGLKNIEEGKVNSHKEAKSIYEKYL